ncbi:Hypothetical protein A7982_02967 [Minicystis rosea]|nr:Hypothetical protein A7982_02967 [Minicystis rosea]
MPRAQDAAVRTDVGRHRGGSSGGRHRARSARRFRVQKRTYRER